MIKNYINKMKIFDKRSNNNLYLIDDEILKCFDIKKKNYKKEYNTVNKLNHKNIIKFKDYFYHRNFFFVIMDHYSKGDLWNLINNKKLTVNEQIYLSKQMTKPIVNLHSNGIVHLDLKLENYLLTKSKDIILIDFEHSREFKYFDQSYDLKYKVGTKNYIAPEINNLKFSIKSDIYSLGVIFYLLVARTFPNKDQVDFSRIYKSPLEPIIINMLQPQSAYRPNIFEVEYFINKLT